jgi:DNA repair photolyase
MSFSLPIRGRGAASNPPNRFEPITLDPDGDTLDAIDAEDRRPLPQTQFFKDNSRTVICENDSPDVGFRFSINPYRGCEHGCIYCYARPTHEYLSLSSGVDFETKIFVKHDAPQLLRKELMRASWRPETISISGVTDCYQPAERIFKITRSCLKVLAEFGNPVGIVSKSHLVTRDIDILSEMARKRLAAVFISITTLRAEVASTMEPRAPAPARRIDAIKKLSAAGIPCGVMVAPLVPGLTDHEMPAILQAAADAGAITCGYVPVRLPFAVKALFEEWLASNFPDRREKVLNRIRSIRDGKLNDSDFHTRMRGAGEFAEQFEAMFKLAKRRYGLDREFPHLSTDLFRRPGEQMPLFTAS